MARRTPRQGAYGVQRARSQPVSTYIAPTFDGAAGQNEMELARAFSGLSQGLGALYGAQTDAENREAAAAAKKRQAQEAQDMRDINAEATVLADELSQLRAEGKSKAEIDNFIRSATTQKFNEKYNLYRADNEGGSDVFGFLETLRNPKLVNALNEAQGANRAAAVFAESEQQFMVEASELVEIGIAHGLTTEQIMADMVNMPSWRETQSKVLEGLNPVQEIHARNELSAIIADRFEVVEKSVFNSQREQISNHAIGRLGSALDVALTPHPDSTVAAANMARDSVELIVENFTGSERESRLNDMTEYLDAWAQKAKADGHPDALIRGILDAFEEGVVIQETGRSLLDHSQDAKSKLARSQSKYVQSPTISKAKEEDAVALIRHGEAFDGAVFDEPTKAGKLNLLETAERGLRAIRAGATELPEDQQEALKRLGWTPEASSLDYANAVQLERKEIGSLSSSELSSIQQQRSLLADTLYYEAYATGQYQDKAEEFIRLSPETYDPVRRTAMLQAAKRLRADAESDLGKKIEVITGSDLFDHEKAPIVAKYRARAAEGLPVLYEDIAADLKAVIGGNEVDRSEVDRAIESRKRDKEAARQAAGAGTGNVELGTITLPNDPEAVSQPGPLPVKLTVEQLKDVRFEDFDAESAYSNYQIGIVTYETLEWLQTIQRHSETELTVELMEEILLSHTTP